MQVTLTENLPLAKKSAHTHPPPPPPSTKERSLEVLIEHSHFHALGNLALNENLMDPLPHEIVHNIPHGTRISSLNCCRDKLKFEEGRYGSHVANRYTLKYN